VIADVESRDIADDPGSIEHVWTDPEGGPLRESRDFAVTVVIQALIGVVAGLIWSAVAPRAPYLATPEGLRLADPSTQAIIAADGWFAVITGAAGLIVGIVAFLPGRRRPLGVLLGLTGGGLVAACLAWWVGNTVNLGPATVTASGVTGNVVPGALELTALGVLIAWPLAATAVFAVLLAVTAYRDSPLNHPAGESGAYGVPPGGPPFPYQAPPGQPPGSPPAAPPGHDPAP